MASAKVTVMRAEDMGGDVRMTSCPHDGLEEYNYEQDKYEVSGGRGKGRTKKEAELNTNRHDPCGHTRKTTQRLINSHEREKDKGRDEHRGKERVEHWGREQHREHGTATK